MSLDASLERMDKADLVGLLSSLCEQSDVVRSLVEDHVASSNVSVLVIGGGGREHALSWKLAQSERVGHVFVAPGNGGTACEAGVSNVPLSSSSFADVASFVGKNNISLVVVGPEQPLVDGLTDYLAVHSPTVAVFGPSKAAARLEASKAYSKEFMEKHGVPSAQFGSFTDYALAQAYLEQLLQSAGRVVIKASGLAAGKGVLLPESAEEAREGLKQVMVEHAFGDAGNEVVIEECLVGEEVSLLAFSDGVTVKAMPGAQDHKRVFDGDAGNNTGGMGVYAPAPALTADIAAFAQREVLQKTVDAMAASGTPYVGVLYAGLTP